jgi:hypothetical protein
MECFKDFLFKIASDSVLFWVLQFSIIFLFLVALIKNIVRKSRGRNSVEPIRGPKSMATFYGSYAALNGLLVGLCLSVEIASNYRVFWVIVDTIIPIYVCLFNPWSRNKLIGFANRLRKLEVNENNKGG